MRRFALKLTSSLLGASRLVGLGFSERVRWSSLRAIGHSRLSQLTVLIPFIGYLLVFNPSFADLFRSTLPDNPSEAPVWLAELHSLRLSFLYFGLLSLGGGVALFNVFSPEQIRKNASVSAYISEMEAVWSPPFVRKTFEEIIERFLAKHDENSAHPVFGSPHPSFPWKPAGYLHDLVAEIFKDCGISYLPSDCWNDQVEGTMVIATPHYFESESGNVLTNKIMYVMMSPRLADRVFSRVMLDGALHRRKEVFFLEYFSSDYNQFWVRLLIFTLFCSGLVLLLVPTLTTSVLVAIAAF